MQGLSVSRYTYTHKPPSGQIGQILTFSQTSPHARMRVRKSGKSTKSVSCVLPCFLHRTHETDGTHYPNMFQDWHYLDWFQVPARRSALASDPLASGLDSFRLSRLTLVAHLTYVPLCDIVNYGLRAIGRMCWHRLTSSRAYEPAFERRSVPRCEGARGGGHFGRGRVAW